MANIAKHDYQARLGRWLYHHGMPGAGNWLYINSRHWREHLRRQYPDCDHIDGIRDFGNAAVNHGGEIMIYASDCAPAEEYSETFAYCPQCGEKLK